MSKIINTPIGVLSYKDYPLITLKTAKKPDSSKLTTQDIDTFFTHFDNIINLTEGPFILLTEISEYAPSNNKSREHFGLAIQHLSAQHKDRFKMNFIYMKNIAIYFILKIVNGFVKPQVPIKTGYNRDKIRSKAFEYINKF